MPKFEHAAQQRAKEDQNKFFIRKILFCTFPMPKIEKKDKVECLQTVEAKQIDKMKNKTKRKTENQQNRHAGKFIIRYLNRQKDTQTVYQSY